MLLISIIVLLFTVIIPLLDNGVCSWSQPTPVYLLDILDCAITPQHGMQASHPTGFLCRKAPAICLAEKQGVEATILVPAAGVVAAT